MGESIFADQFFNHVQGYNQVCATPWGLGECRMCLSGKELILSCPLDLVPGETVVAKTAYMCSMSKVQIATMVAKPNVVRCIGQSGTAVFIPAGHPVLLQSADGSTTSGLQRGSCNGASEVLEGVFKTVRHMLEDYPTLADAGHKQWQTYLEGLINKEASL